jgi:hypothetical protein
MASRASDHQLRQIQSFPRRRQRTLTVQGSIAFCGNPFHIAVEGQFALGAKPLGVFRQRREAAAGLGGKRSSSARSTGPTSCRRGGSMPTLRNAGLGEISVAEFGAGQNHTSPAGRTLGVRRQYQPSPQGTRTLPWAANRSR